MSIWAEIKKAVNSDLNTPLNVLIENGVIGNCQLFTKSGEFEVPKGVRKILVSAIGSGGGGGGSGSAYCFNATYTNGYYIPRGASGGGGGSGEFVIDEPYAVTPGAKIPITINPGGSGGTGATATENANGNAGGTGGATIVGDLLTVNGGNGGGGATYVKVASSTNDGNVTGIEGEYGIGGVNGSRGTRSDWKGNNSEFLNVPGGAGGIASDIFTGLYGQGGSGGESVIADTTATWFGGNAGNAGMSGAVLICWGQFDHETVY
jgi:hypothetical protein